MAAMRRIDELYLEHPFEGSLIMRDLLRDEGVAIGRERVAPIMHVISIEALCRRPSTFAPASGHGALAKLERACVEQLIVWSQMLLAVAS